jgi:hypothetical protein
MHAISRRLALLALGALTLFGTGCGDTEKAVGVPGTIDGTYTLRTVNGKNVPGTLYESSEGSSYYKVEVTAGQVTLGEGRSFDIRTTIRETSGSSTPTTRQLTSSGRYTMNQNTLTLMDQANELTYTLTLQADGSLRQSGTIATIPITATYVRQ